MGRGVLVGNLVVRVYGSRHALSRLLAHVGEVVGLGVERGVASEALVVSGPLQPLQRCHEPRLVEPDLLSGRSHEGRWVGEERHLAAQVEQLGRASQHVERAIEQGLAAAPAYSAALCRWRRAVGHIEHGLAPGADLGYVVAVVDRVEEDAIDRRRLSQRRHEVRHEVVAGRGVSKVPEPTDAVLVARVLLLAVGAAELEAAAARLQEEVLVARVGHERPHRSVHPEGPPKRAVDEHGERGVGVLDYGHLRQLRVDHRRHVVCQAEVLPPEDGHRILADRSDLPRALPVSGVRPEPGRREARPVVGPGPSRGRSSCYSLRGV
mmetsp:Transcript_5775/g.13450  ORF Transcript_5775/g.13450 Transcript_5775/m.13450 type:complete len:322 (+) Transcript_5775:311-1276(+)